MRSAAATTAVATAEQAGLAKDERRAADESSRLTGRKVKVIGLGPRGYSALERLNSSGLTAADMWCLDSEQRSAAGRQSIHFRRIQEGVGSPGVSQEQIDEIVGEGARDRGGKGNANAGDGGVAFVLSSSGPSPGGPDRLLQLVRGLRAAGIFVAVAVTQPFVFEGPKKRQAAESLIAQLHNTAHLVAVIDQEVLAGVKTGAAGAPMTMADATRFADNALEHVVRTLLAALSARAILESTQGALRWDGLQYEKKYRRLLSPPLQRLLTQPGVAVLGRGGSAMPAQHVAGLGPKGGLMQLASEAVRAAAQSPFLERAVGRATAVLCCVYLPDRGLPSPGGRGPMGKTDDAMARMAVQAAAGALSLACPCDNIVMCAVLTPSDQLAQEGTGPASVDVQASILVLHDPHAQAIALPSVAPAAASPRAEAKPKRVAARPVLMPNATWNAMSALAGGTARRQAGPEPAAALDAAAAAPAARAGAAGRQTPVLKAKQAQQETVTMGDYLVKSLTAHSLDLPPQAAKWRQQQREGTGGQRPRLIIREAGLAAEEGEAALEAAGPLDGALRGLLGLPAERPVDVRGRTSGILQQDREELWDFPDG